MISRPKTQGGIQREYFNKRDSHCANSHSKRMNVTSDAGRFPSLDN